MSRALRAPGFIAALIALTALAAAAQPRPALGPVDGKDLPALDTGRVTVGSIAPDFRLEAKEGGTVTLSQFRGAKSVVLVFYRGHW